MARGRTLVKCAVDGDLDGFKKLFSEEAELQHLMVWHIQKALKEAIKYRKILIAQYIVEELDIKLNNECFSGYLHRIVRMCSEAEEDKDEAEQEVNRTIVKLLC